MRSTSAQTPVPRVSPFVVGVLLVCLTTLASAQEYADRVLLNDGTVAEGLLVEQSPGNYLLFEGAEGTLHFVPGSDLRAIEHNAGREVVLEYEDVLLLRSGLILRGTITQDAPGRYVVIDTAEEPVTVSADEIWKVMRRPVPPQDESDSTPVDRGEAVTLQLEITLGRNRRAHSTGDTGATAGAEAGSDQGSLGGLIEDLAEVETARLEQEAEECASQRDQERERVESSAATLDEGIAELERLARVCEEGPVREKGNGDDVQMVDVDAATIPGEATGYSRWRLDEVGDQLRANSESLAQQATSPAGDPTTLAALEERFEIRAHLNSIMAPRVGSGSIQHLRIRRNAAGLPLFDRELLYDTNRRHDQLMGIGLNTIPLLNLGSWFQGDFAGAAVNTALMIGGGALLWRSAAYADGYRAVETPVGVVRMPDPPTMLYAGVATMAAAYISSLVRPIWYDIKCNRMLADSLDVRP